MTVSVIQVHDTTVPHLSTIEKFILDELVRLGRAVIVSEMPGMPAGCTGNAVVSGKN